MFLVPNFKGITLFPPETRIPFMRFKGVCLIGSFAAMILSVVLILTVGFNFGVDFKGGSMIEVQHKSGPVDLASLRKKLGSLGLGEVQIQEFGAPDDILIRVEEQPGGEEAQQEAVSKIVAALGDDYIQRRVEIVGPAVSSELRTTGIIAVLISLIGISVYVWFRFEWQFAIGAVLSLTHDVLIV